MSVADPRLHYPGGSGYTRVVGWLIAAVVALLLSACSNKEVRSDAAPQNEVAATQSKGPESPTEALDPWEPTNRKIYAFNKQLDDHVMKPVARVWLGFPKPVRQGVANFYDNLQEPIVAVNLLARGEPHKSWQSTVRFLLNTLFGVAGIFDVAAAGGVPEYRGDFGQTFAAWGWDTSRYVMLPVFGPSTVRDGVGKFINSRVSPIRQVGYEVGPGFSIMYGVISRANALPNEAFTENAVDEYLLIRDVYFQRRDCQLRDCTQDLPDYELPEELGVPEPERP